MRKFRNNKLWRDKMPQKAQEQGTLIHIKYLTDAEYDEALRKKLIEEASEIRDAQSADIIEAELADLFEAIDALCAFHKIDKNNVRALQEKKFIDRGGFYERKFVTISESPEGSYLANYCLNDPEKYPEIIEP